MFRSALRKGDTKRRLFHASALRSARALIYKTHGKPTEVLEAVTYPESPLDQPPRPGTLNVKFLLSSLNPADLNTIEGVYPSRPGPSAIHGTQLENVYIAGNEGVAEVTAVGTAPSGSSELSVQVGDWVIMDKPQRGTWATARNLNVEDVVKIEKVPGLTAPLAASMMVNLCTARNLLDASLPQRQTCRDTVIMQNGANSGVGQAVIQMAAADGVFSINFVRNRDNFHVLEQNLKDLGATYVFTYDDLANKDKRKQIATLAEELSEDGKGAHLGLNCVGGDATTHMTSLIRGPSPLFITYGNMSRQPFTFSAGSQIFSDLRLHGFWQSRKAVNQTRQERKAVHSRILQYIEKGELMEPEHDILKIPRELDDGEATEMVRQAIRKLEGGRYGKKMMLQLE